MDWFEQLFGIERDFGSGSGVEDFVGDVEEFARQSLLDDGDAEVAGQSEH